MMGRVTARWKFFLERILQRGIWHQVVVMAALIALVAVLGGATAWLFTDDFESLSTAVWWSFLRLTDPGYLGDDQGAVLRTVSTVVTVLGYVLFMGSLIAIMTQWLARSMRQLESGTTPIAVNGHILILGWTSRTPEIIEQLLASTGRLKRFLQRKRSHSLKIVILADTVTLELTQQLRDRIGRSTTAKHVVFRSGSSLKSEHLRRVDLAHAAAVIVPGADFEGGGWELRDTRVIKTLMAVHRFVSESDHQVAPSVVVELASSARGRIANSIMPTNLESVTGPNLAGGVLAQILKNPGLSLVYDYLFSPEQPGSLYLRSASGLAGSRLAESLLAFKGALPIGIVRQPEGEPAQFVTDLDARILDSDLLAFVASDYEACEQSAAPVEHLSPLRTNSAREAAAAKILVLGWSHKIFPLLRELEGSSAKHIQIDLLSRVSEPVRAKTFEQFGRLPDNQSLNHLVGDYTADKTLAELDLGAYDSIAFLASDNMENAEQADARSTLAYALVKDMLGNAPKRPQLLLELMDSENAHLFEGEEAEVMVSPKVVSHLLAQIAMRPELAIVYRGLFGSDGPDIVFRNPADFGLIAGAGREDMVKTAASRGELALALLARSGEPRFLLGSSGTQEALKDGDRLVCVVPGSGQSGE